MFLTTMNWIGKLFRGDSVAGGLAILALAVTIGLFLGAIRVRRMKLGIPGVLFSALLFGQLGLTIDPKILGFLRDFALILFMYAIGLQVGPGFIASLRTEGLRLNLLSVAVLVLGAAMTAAGSGVLGRSTSPGVYCGAFTTTAGLAAAQEALRGAPGAKDEREATAIRAGLAYSITYPFGIIGPVLVIVLLKRVFRVSIDEERHALAALEDKRRPPIEVVDFEVTEAAHAGKLLRNHPLLRDNGIVFSRLLRAGTMTIPSGNTEVQVGDIFRAVGSRERVEELVALMGKRSETDLTLTTSSGDIQRMELIVTRTRVLRKSLRELNLHHRTGVTVVRINRAGVDLVSSATLRLAFADHVTVVGPKEGLKAVEKELGNCPDTLNRPQLVPIFLGIVIGVVVGSIPFTLPGLNAAFKIGLAGGPLIAAIALSQFGNIGSIVWYMPTSANQLFRDFGLAVFLACVGLQAGDHFIQRAAHGSGLEMVLWGAAVTVLPVLLVGCFARAVLKMNFITLAGWVAGAMTSSPALLFADEMSKSEAPAVAYAAVAPLATLVPIFCAQMLAILSR
jgi:putative transport protein